MEYGDIKTEVHVGVGNSKFQDESGTDVTDTILLASINAAQKRIARIKDFGDLYGTENIFLATNASTLTPIGSIRKLETLILWQTETETYTSQTTDLPYGLYVDQSTSPYTVYRWNQNTQSFIIPGLHPKIFQKKMTVRYAQQNRPELHSLYSASKVLLSSRSDANYIAELHCKLWPTPFTSTSEANQDECDLTGKEDLVILAAQIHIYTNVKKEPNKANHLYAVYRDLLKDAIEAEEDKGDLDVIQQDRTISSEFPGVPTQVLSRSDLGLP